MSVIHIDAGDAPLFDSFGVPISHATVHNDAVYVAGQTGIDPETNELIEGGTAAETRQTMENIEAILEAAGTSLSNLVRVTIFLQDMDDFATVNDAYTEFVSEPYPARSAVEVSDFAPDFDVEIEATAALSNSNTSL